MRRFYCFIAILVSPILLSSALGAEEHLATINAKEQIMFRRNLQNLLDEALEEGAVFLSTLNQLRKHPTKLTHSTFKECYKNIQDTAKEMEALCSLDSQVKEGLAWSIIAEIIEERLLVDEFMNEEEILAYMKTVSHLKNQELANLSVIKMTQENSSKKEEGETPVSTLSDTAEATTSEYESLEKQLPSEEVSLRTEILPPC
ncbi:hypothetical protein [Chlamydiifrater phoenicopteri]|uniref:hypothetical protein n=1 Tax=Chlamydiifrater phoenicopteri TaxID=2681469 RepID=UPI001BD17D83|nr:hypothetical protein [Chlamydiifrater phoenicopteri]